MAQCSQAVLIYEQKEGERREASLKRQHAGGRVEAPMRSPTAAWSVREAGKTDIAEIEGASEADT